MKDITPSFNDASNKLLEKLTKEDLDVLEETDWGAMAAMGVGFPLVAGYLSTKMQQKMQDDRQKEAEEAAKKAAEGEEEPSNSEGSSEYDKGYDKGYDTGYGQGYEDAKKEAGKAHQLPRIPRHRQRA